MIDDLELLRAYATEGSEDAFRAVLERHVGFVHAAALRQVRDPQLAEEVTQAVFVVLARKAGSLRPGTVLVGWLFRTIRFAAARAVRAEQRRQRREQEAARMEPMTSTRTTDASWDEIAPALDEAIADLGDTDRQAILLRFFEARELKAVGRALGSSEEAAKKRVSRALEKLRSFFVRRGMGISATALAGVLADHAVQAAPVGLSTSVLAAVTTNAGAITTIALAKATLKAMFYARLQTAGIAVGVLLAVTGVGIALAQKDTGNAVSRIETPDPRALLQTVAQARQKITSGELAMEVESYEFSRPQDGTNHMRLQVVFDGPKRRFEADDREYAYVFMGPEAGTVIDAKMRGLGMDREAAVRAGLLTGFEAHYVTTYDGAVLLRYRASDGRPEGTELDDPAKGSYTYVFDPRCLGLWTWLSLDRTVENCLRYEDAKAISLIGKESVEGLSTWHVRVKSKYDETLDFWIDAARPQRVVKHRYGADVALSKFDDTKPDDPIPTEVRQMDFRNGSPQSSHRFVRRQTRFNVAVDPASWTLAGLEMPVGTEVVDVRLSRRIGYWDRVRLAKDLPAGTPPSATRRDYPSPAKLLALVEQDPKSAFALEAAAWIILQTSDGPEVEKAAEVIRREHARSTNLFYLCQGLERMRVRPRCARALLETALRESPSAAVQAHASFSLAALLRSVADEQSDPSAAIEAERLLGRVIADYGQFESDGGKLADRAKPQLAELRRVGIGKAAPETEGLDLGGQPLTLSDYHGKVVVLKFWGTWCGPCMRMIPDERKLVERLAGKPFALIGVNSDPDLAKVRTAVAKERITWPSFQDGGIHGPIAMAWNVQSWPATIVLDPKGVIRYRNVQGQTLSDAVDALLREAR